MPLKQKTKVQKAKKKKKQKLLRNFSFDFSMPISGKRCSKALVKLPP
jgi:hypothetical protein